MTQPACDLQCNLHCLIRAGYLVSFKAFSEGSIPMLMVGIYLNQICTLVVSTQIFTEEIATRLLEFQNICRAHVTITSLF